MNARQNQTTKLKNGRTLGFAEYGDVNGTPVFHFNGSCGSRLEHPPELSILTEAGIQLICTDRPGHGLSSPQPDRRVIDWPEDVIQLANHLGIEKFYLLGWSAGGPYAHACAYKYPERIIAYAIVSGLAPPDRPKPYSGLPFSYKLLLFIMRRFPKLNYFFRKQMAGAIQGDVESVGAKLAGGIPKEDQLLLQDKQCMEMFVKDVQEGFKQGWNGPAEDDITINSPWGFSMEEITIPSYVWQGTLDSNVPLLQGKYQHKVLKNSKLIIVENQAHLFLLAMWKEVLLKLVR